MCWCFLTDALFGHAVVRCHFTSPDGHDAVYLEQYYFNKVLLYQYNSTLGKMIGYTAKAKQNADVFNKNPSFVNVEKLRTEHCKRDVRLFYNHFLNPGDHHRTHTHTQSLWKVFRCVTFCSLYYVVN